MLNAIAHIVLNTALVVDPRYAEREYAVGHAKTLDEVIALKFRVFVVDVFNRHQYLFYCLQIFRLVGKAATQVVDYFFCFHFNNAFIFNAANVIKNFEK